VPPVPPLDETDLPSLVKIIWHQKRLIALAIGVSGLIAVAYAFLATPQYQVSSVLRPAAINELDTLNRSEIYHLPPNEALKKLGATLESYDARLGFFRANQKLFKEFERPGRTLEQSFEEFNRNSINLIFPDPKKSDSLSAYIKLEMNYPQGIDGVAILNGFVEYAIAFERNEISADVDVIIKNRLNELQGKLDTARTAYDVQKEAKIASLSEGDTLRRAQLHDELKALREQLKTQRSDRMAQLNEAVGIARSLGIRKPTTPSSLGDSYRSGSSSVMRTEINNQQIPLYFMGVEALEAEHTALQQRKSDDFTDGRIAQIAKELQLLESNREIEVLNSRGNEDLFLAGVEPLRAEMSRLRNLNIDISHIKLVAIDQSALEPLAPIAPKRALIVLLSLVLGAILGVFAVLIRHSVMMSRARSRSETVHVVVGGAALGDASANTATARIRNG